MLCVNIQLHANDWGVFAWVGLFVVVIINLAGSLRLRQLVKLREGHTRADGATSKSIWRIVKLCQALALSIFVMLLPSIIAAAFGWPIDVPPGFDLRQFLIRLTFDFSCFNQASILNYLTRMTRTPNISSSTTRTSQRAPLAPSKPSKLKSTEIESEAVEVHVHELNAE